MIFTIFSLFYLSFFSSIFAVPCPDPLESITWTSNSICQLLPNANLSYPNNNITNIDFKYSTIDCNGNSGLTIYTFNVILSNVNFINCNSQNNGGAIYYISCSLTINNSSFSNCNSQNNGGAIYYNSGSLTIYNSSFNNCSAQYGGAIESYTNNNLTINDSSFNNCSAQYGGAIRSYSNSNLTINNSSFNNCYSSLSGSAVYSYTGGNLYINNNTFTNCYSNSNGGVIYNNNNNLNIIYSKFINCSSLIAAGAIFNAGKMNISYSTFTKCNTRTNAGGGAIYSSGVYFSISNSFFEDCYSNGGYGGAIQTTSSINEIQQNNFINCYANTGGGISISNNINNYIKSNSFYNCSAVSQAGGLYFTTLNGFLIVEKCNFINCSSISNKGGAMYSEYGNLTLKDSLFHNCSSGNVGGGLCVNSKNEIINTSFISCRANVGGGGYSTDYIYNVIKNCTFNGCISSGQGGAIFGYNINSNSTIDISNSIFIYNKALYSGVFYINNRLNIDCCLFYNNTVDYYYSIGRNDNLINITNSAFVRNSVVDNVLIRSDVNNTITMKDNYCDTGCTVKYFLINYVISFIHLDIIPSCVTDLNRNYFNFVNGSVINVNSNSISTFISSTNSVNSNLITSSPSNSVNSVSSISITLSSSDSSNSIPTTSTITSSSDNSTNIISTTSTNSNSNSFSSTSTNSNSNSFSSTSTSSDNSNSISTNILYYQNVEISNPINTDSDIYFGENVVFIITNDNGQTLITTSGTIYYNSDINLELSNYNFESDTISLFSSTPEGTIGSINLIGVSCYIGELSGDLTSVIISNTCTSDSNRNILKFGL